MFDIEEKIKSILTNAEPEQKRNVSLLAEEIHEQRLAIFVGAGCSVYAGLPSWKELIDNILEKYKIQTKEQNLLRLATRLEKDLGSLKFRKNITERLTTKPGIKSILHDLLISLDAQLYITTNYDHLLEDSFNRKGYAPQIVWQDNDLPNLDPQKNRIVKIHGDINSPTSLVITSTDYRKFKTEHRAFVNWLNSIISTHSLLFVGTSFEDPRLKEADEHVLGLFGEFRLQPFIVLKVPSKDPSTSDDDYLIELSDFEALCDDFKARGFYLFIIKEFDEIKSVLNQVNDEVTRLKQKVDTSNLKPARSLQTDHADTLEKKTRDLINTNILDLAEGVHGHGRLPTKKVMQDRAKNLREKLEKEYDYVNNESKLVAWCSLADAYLNSQTKKDIEIARECYEKANLFFLKMDNRNPWEEKILRLRAKLLFFEGKIDDAINTVAESNDDKTISLFLAFLIDSNRINDAYNFVISQGKNPKWACEAIYILVSYGEVNQANELFSKTLSGFNKAKTKGNLEHTPYKGDYFFEKLFYNFASALYYRALKTTGKRESENIYPGELTKEGESLCEKTNEIIDRLFQRTSKENPSVSLFITSSLLIDLGASQLLGKWTRADDDAYALLSVQPIFKEVAGHFLIRSSNFQNEVVEHVIERLSEDYPDQAWSLNNIASLQCFALKKEEAWNTLQKAASISFSKKDKSDLAMTIWNIGLATKQADRALGMAKNILQQEDHYIQLLEAFYYLQRDDYETADNFLKKLMQSNPPNDILGEINYIYGQRAIKEKKWAEARSYLEKSFNNLKSPTTLKDLLLIATQLQDDVVALQIAEKLALYGTEDPDVMRVLAQTSRNLRQFHKSEKAWQTLFDQFPDNPAYAYGLAEIFILQDKPSDDALKILHPFIQCDKQINLNCLLLACDIYIAEGKDVVAFNLLDECESKIENEPALLFKHMDLSYRSGNDDAANKSLLRIQVLQQEGKIPKEALIQVSIDEAKEMMLKRRETKEQMLDLYTKGHMPRLVLCQNNNVPLYLDWAIRTQKLVLPEDSKDWVDSTIYSTNSFRIEFIEKRGNQLEQITSPSKINEIVIDYHALITIHRLGLMDRLSKKYNKIYYASVLKDIWANDQQRFKPHQLSQKILYEKLDKRLKTGQIKESLANVSEKNYIPFKRNIILAESEQLPLVDAYVDDKELNDFPEVNVIRLSQLVKWLYEKGRISENHKDNVGEKIGAECASRIQNFKEILDDSYKVLIDEITLKLMEQYELVQPLIDMGVLIFVEKYTANSIRYAERSFNFINEAGEWHRELSNIVKKLDLFNDETPEFREKHEDIYTRSFMDSMKLAEEKNLFLLTDDRSMQMLRTDKLVNRQFGTDALLNDLYNTKPKIISLEEYSKSFLKLCVWRYRFLIPDLQILIYFAKEFISNPPGDPLIAIADYGKKCMEDHGLLMGMEPTEPPMQVGVKLYLSWIHLWVRFLVQLHLDVSFKTLPEFTNWVFLYALPYVPKGLTKEVQDNLIMLREKDIVWQILLASGTAKEPSRLHMLLDHAFISMSFNEEKKKSEMNYYLNLIEGLKHDPDTRRIFIIKAFQAFYGTDLKKQKVDPAFAPILNKYGLLDHSGEIPASEIAKLKDVSYALSKQDDIRKNIDEYLPGKPFIIIPTTDKNKFDVITLHDVIQAPLVEVRINAIAEILNSKDITDITKQLVKEKQKFITSTDKIIWHPTAKEVSDVLLGDYYYSLSVFRESFKANNTQLTEDAWKGVMNPKINSVLNSLPILLQGSLESREIKHRVNMEINKTENKKLALFNEKLSWYLNEIFFIPVGYPLNAWNILPLINKSDQKLKSSDVLFMTKQWLKSKEIKDDPLAYLMALDLVLRARISSEKSEENDFTSQDFNSFLGFIFDVLLFEETAHADKNDFLKKVSALWEMRTLLARYYLQYINLNTEQKLEEEVIVALAWFLSRETVRTLSKAMIYLNMIDEDQTAWLKERTDKIVRQSVEAIQLKSLVEDNRRIISIGHYYTIDSNIPLATSLLSLIMPTSQEKAPFNGLLKPSEILPAKVTNIIIDSLTSRTLLGEGQLHAKEKQFLPLLWNTSFCKSSSVFLREYYGTAFKLLGKEKVSIIETAENLAKEDFLERELGSLPELLKNKQGPSVALLLSSLVIFVQTRGTMPESAKLFKDYDAFVKDVFDLESIWIGFCLGRFISIIKRLYLGGNSEWIDVLERYLFDIDYDKCPDDSIDLIIGSLLDIVIVGYDIKIIKHVLAKKFSDKRIREYLRRIKPNLEYFYPRVLPEFRENISRILNELIDIPSL